MMRTRLTSGRGGRLQSAFTLLAAFSTAMMLADLGAPGARAQVNYEPTYPDSPETTTPSNDTTLSQPVITPEDGPLQIVPTRVMDGVGPRPPVEQRQTNDRTQMNARTMVPAQSLDEFDALAPRGQGVSVFGLDQIDPAGIGILTEDNEGFRRDMWRGSDRQVIVDLLPFLPMNITSPTMRDLARRLLLTAAEAPPLAPENTVTGTAPDPNDLLRARVRSLFAGGDLQALASLFERLPTQLNDSALTRARVNTRLLTGDRAAACSEANAANERDRE